MIKDIKKKNRTKKICISASLLCLIVVISVGQPNSTAQTQTQLDEIETYLESEVLNSLIPGLAVGIVKNDKTIYTKGFGIAGPGRTMTAQTPMSLCSISKSFTAIGILQLVESGAIQLDAKVKDYLPWFKMANESASSQITVEHLLYHISGISTASGVKNFYGNETIEEFVRSLELDSLQSTPGTKFEYSNANYNILGLLIENRTGLSFEQYIEANIFRKLNMTNSYFSETGALTSQHATLYSTLFGVHIPFELAFNPAYNPSGFIISTADDMCNYMIAQLNEGRYNSTSSVLTPENMLKSHFLPEDFEGNTYYAMGWGNVTLNEVPILQHTGGVAGITTNIIIAPENGGEEGWGVFTMINTQNVVGQLTSHLTIAFNVLNMLMEKPTWSVISPLFIYVIFDIVVAVSIALHIWLFVKSKGKTIKLIARYDTIKEKRKKASIRIIIDFVLAIIILVGVPPILGILLGGDLISILTFNLLTLIIGIPDLAILLIILGAGFIAEGILRVILTRKNLKNFSIETEDKINAEAKLE